MFTGLIKDIGEITQITNNREGRKIRIRSSKLSSQIQVDDSVAINGVCQTVTWIKRDEFDVQAVLVTLQKTTLERLRPGDQVNLELALQGQDRLGGHFVQGHINGVGTLTRIEALGKNYQLTLNFPPELRSYIVQEGSLAVDGISLTVAKHQRGHNHLVVSIIPHTWEHTILKNKRVGDKVNLEVDILAKYVENCLFYMEKSNKKV